MGLTTLSTAIKRYLVLLNLVFFSNSFLPSYTLHAQGFSTITPISVQSATKNTGDKPQSKVWKYDGKWFTVFPNSTGTNIWRLDGTSWTSVLRLTTGNNTRADCKVVNNVVHIFLWKKEGTSSQLFSVEYVPATSTYKLWSQRGTATTVTLETGTENGVIDIDSKGRMWLTSDAVTDIIVRYSDYPYTSWSAPIVFASGVKDDDISTVIALPNQKQIAIFWSNQNTKRFGFKVHNDNDAPTVWSADEAPGAQNAFDNIGGGLGDDHMNLKYASDGTLYCAVKTSYDTPGYTRLGLFKRSATGTWSPLYNVSESGTRAICLLNESSGKVKLVFSEQEDGGNIFYKESSMDNVAFGPTQTLIPGFYNNSSSSKENYTSDVVVIASNGNSIVDVVGVLATDGVVAAPVVPTLVSPADLSSGVSVTPTLTWSTSPGASTYRVQLSTVSDFSTVLNEVTQGSTSYQASDLQYNATYFWRVQASNQSGTSPWSAGQSFSTLNPYATTPALVAPATGATGVTINPTLTWGAATNATSYNVQVSIVSDFSSTVIAQTGITSTSLAIAGLQNNTLYYWRVQSVNPYGASAYSLSFSFTTIVAVPSVPSLATPANSSTNNSITPSLSWSGVTNATSYSLQVSTSSSFASYVINLTGLANTTYQTPSLNYATTYYWKVASANGGGTSGWSQVFSFTTVAAVPATPSLITPNADATGVSISPTLTWSSVTGATSYNVQVSTASDFATLVSNQSGLANTSLSLTTLNSGATYFWRAQATNSSGSSAWTSASKFTTAAAVAGNDLVGYWAMNEGSGAFLSDKSAYANNGSITGSPTWVSGVAGSALRLSGSQQYAIVPDANSLDITQSITLAAWIKPEKLASQNIMKKGTTGGEDGYELTLLSTGKIQFRFNQNSSTLYNLNSNALYPTDGNTFMHIAATYSNAVVKIYINGVLNKSATFTAPPPIATNSQPLIIGGPNLFTGTLDEVRVYNYALDATQISAIATPGNPAIAASAFSTVEVLPETKSAGESLNFYPNPVQDKLTIDFTGEEQKNVTIAIADSQGRIHYHAAPAIENDRLEIDMNSLNVGAGLHVLVIKTAVYQKVFKFVKK